MNCDLHTHSIYSDGTFSPAEIIAKAKESGLGAVALTDHNTVAGLPEFMEQGSLQGVTAVDGIEFSTTYKGKEFHLLGLFIGKEHYNAVEGLAKEYRLLKEISNIETIERLNEAGYDISYADIKKQNSKENINRAHIASELLKKGYISSIAEAFETMLSESAGYYVPSAHLGLLEGISFLKSIKALSVIAHPLKDTDEAGLRELLPSAIEAGLDGIEVCHSDYDSLTSQTALRICEEFSLLRSGGSDFHGMNKPDISLGVGRGDIFVPMEYYDTLYAEYLSLQK